MNKELKKIDPNKYINDLSYSNSGWNEYWKQVYSDMYKDNELSKELQRVQVDIDICINKIKSLQLENDDLLEENIELGIRIDDLKHVVNLQVQQIKELQSVIGNKPTNIFDTATMLIKQRKLLHIQRNEIEQRKVLQLENKAENIVPITLQGISDTTVEKILHLKLEGLNYTEIAKRTGVSTATVSRYIRKNKKRLNDLEQSNGNLINH